MYSEENERLSEQAYNRFRTLTGDGTLFGWEQYRPKHLFRDLVQTFEANPRSHISIANKMEQAVSEILTEKAEGSIPVAAEIAPDSEPVKPKTGKSKK